MIKPYNKAEITFDIIREVSQEGKNSKVFLVRDHQLDAELVVKRMEKRDFTNSAEFFSESKILYFSSHPNVVQVHYACEDEDYIYISMPFYRNGSLKQLIETRYLTVREIIRYAFHFIGGLQNIHSKKLIHFDIKPDNILLSDRNEALLSDFGLTKFTNLSGVAGQDLMYAKQRPPESFDGDQFTVAFDIYQVGITLYRLCNGNRTFYEQLGAFGDRSTFDRDRFKFEVRRGRFPDRDKFCLHIPEKLKKVVKKCIEPNPDDRYKSCVELLNALAEVEGEELDWQFTEEPNCRKWTKTLEAKQYILEVDDGENSKAKTVNSSGNERRITQFCKENISKREIKSFLRTY